MNGPIATLTTLAAADDPLSHVLAHELFSFGDYSFTNHVLMLLVAAVLLAILLPWAARSKGLVPRGFRNMIEATMQFVREEMARPALGEHTDRFVPFLWTMFFLILTANLLGMVPIGAVAGGFDAHLAHIGGTATGNIMITAGLALCAFVYIHLSGIRVQGAGGYAKSFFLGHFPLWLAPLTIPIEILGALIKPFALAIRLFANMVAGHIVLAVLLGFATYGAVQGGAYFGVTVAGVLGALAISLLELFVAFLQAYIFTFLTILFIGAAVHVEH